jgi:hypothetical protein
MGALVEKVRNASHSEVYNNLKRSKAKRNKFNNIWK